MLILSHTDLSDLFLPEPATVHTIIGRASEGPSAVSTTPAARKPKRRASNQQTISEAIPGTMSEAELAAFLGIATCQVRTKTREGVFVKDGRGRWNVRESLRNYLSQLRDQANTSGRKRPAGKRISTGTVTLSKPQIARQKKGKLYPGMSFIYYLENSEYWESEFQPFIEQALADPRFPQITKSFELTRYVKDNLIPSDLRRSQRRDVMMATRLIWTCYVNALEDASREAENELLV